MIRYCAPHHGYNDKTSDRFTLKNGRAMGCLSWVIQRKMTAIYRKCAVYDKICQYFTVFPFVVANLDAWYLCRPVNGVGARTPHHQTLWRRHGSSNYPSHWHTILPPLCQEKCTNRSCREIQSWVEKPDRYPCVCLFVKLYVSVVPSSIGNT